jgi:UDP-N-acetylglucosamine 3-dehydrogenase
MAVDLGSCDRLISAAQAAGVQIAVSHNQLFYGPHQRLFELVDDGALGTLRNVYARLWIADRYGGWREDPAIVGGGLLMDAGVHRVYVMRAIGGPVTAVTASMDLPRAEEAFALTFEFASGATGVVQASYYAPEGVFDDRIDVVGSEGVASVAGCEAYFEGELRDEPQLRVRVGGEWRDEPVTDSWEDSLHASVAQALVAFAGRGRPLVDATAGRETVALIDAAYRAAETGARVVTEDLLSDVGSRA